MSGDDGGSADSPLSADDLVARAIQHIIQSVPGDVEEMAPVESATSQPWAETASPSAKNKRPLEELLTEYAERVAAAPDARAPAPAEAHPSASFFDRFGRTAPGSDLPRRKRRRRFGGGRRGRGGGDGAGDGGDASTPSRDRAEGGGRGDAPGGRSGRGDPPRGGSGGGRRRGGRGRSR